MKKINKVMSVLLTLAVAASLFVVGAPASAAVGPVTTGPLATGPLTTGPLNYGVQTEPIEQAWYGIDLPATYTYVVSGNRDDFPNLEDDSVEFHRIIKMIYNLDESAIYAIAEIMDKNNPDTITVGVFKSTTAGRSWTRCKTGFESLIDANYQEFGCADIVASTVQSSDIFFTDGQIIYATRDGGKTWTLIRDLYVDFPDDDTPIKTIDYIYNNGAEVIYVGTGWDVYILELINGRGRWDKTQVFENHGADPAETGTQVLLVKADSTSYASKQGVLAVVLIDGKAILTKRYNQTRWNQVGSKDVIVATVSELETAGSFTPEVDGASIWLPEDYATAGIAYVSLHVPTGAINPVFEVSATESVAEFIHVSKHYAVTNVTGIGTSANYTLVVGGAEVESPSTIGYSTSTVLHTEDNGAYYQPATIDPIGIDWAYVLLLSDYANQGHALAGTAGEDVCGVSLTTDYCDTFIQISMIGEPLGRILDVAGDIYVLTEGILWRNISGYWERVKCNVTATETVTDLDLEVASDGSLFIADMNHTPIWISTNNGLSFAKMTKGYELRYPGTPKGISAWYPVNKNSLIVADNGYIGSTVDGGANWKCCENTVGTTTDLIYVDGMWYAVAVKVNDAATKATITTLSSEDGEKWAATLVVAGDVDGSAESYGASIAYAGTPFVVADFEMTKTVRGEVETITKLYKYNAATKKYATIGDVIYGAGIVADTFGSGLDSEGTGMVYVLTPEGEIVRYRGTDGYINGIASPCAQLAAETVTQIWLTKSGTDNVLWAQNAKGVYKYVDTFNTHGDGLTATVTKNEEYGYDINVSWNAMDNAYEYIVVASNVNKYINLFNGMDLFDEELGLTPFYGDYFWAEDLIATADSEDYIWATKTSMTSAVIPEMGPSQIVYYNVWAIIGGSDDSMLNNTTHFVASFAYANPNAKITTPLGSPIFLTPNAYVNGNLAWGAADVQADNAQITWADSYTSDGIFNSEYAHELRIVKYTDNQDYLALLDKASSITIPAGCFSYSPVLEYNTAYAVAVRAVNEDTNGEWGYLVFSTVENSPYGGAGEGGAAVVITNTTIDFPAPVTVTEHTMSCEPDTLTVTVPAPTTYTLTPAGESSSSSTPIYIWVIIAIGAILCIAVIVLIVRTRRVA